MIDCLRTHGARARRGVKIVAAEERENGQLRRCWTEEEEEEEECEYDTEADDEYNTDNDPDQPAHNGRRPTLGDQSL